LWCRKNDHPDSQWINGGWLLPIGWGCFVGTGLAFGLLVDVFVDHRPSRLLGQLVKSAWLPFQEKLEAGGLYVPRFVEKEVEKFLCCGDPVEGFAWLKCQQCETHELVTFSCKGRGFCPSCGGRRMSTFAARWVDEVFPRVPVRQFVLTVPWANRWLLARKPQLAKGLLAIGLREIQRLMRKKTRRKSGKGGSVTVIQRFGSALNLNVHFHALVIDGVYDIDDRTGQFRFFRAKPIGTEDVEALILRIAQHCERWLGKKGFGKADLFAEDTENALLFCMARR